MILPCLLAKTNCGRKRAKTTAISRKPLLVDVDLEGDRYAGEIGQIFALGDRGVEQGRLREHVGPPLVDDGIDPRLTASNRASAAVATSFAETALDLIGLAKSAVEKR